MISNFFSWLKNLFFYNDVKEQSFNSEQFPTIEKKEPLQPNIFDNSRTTVQNHPTQKPRQYYNKDSTSLNAQIETHQQNNSDDESIIGITTSAVILSSLLSNNDDNSSTFSGGDGSFGGGGSDSGWNNSNDSSSTSESSSSYDDSSSSYDDSSCGD